MPRLNGVESQDKKPSRPSTVSRSRKQTPKRSAAEPVPPAAQANSQTLILDNGREERIRLAAYFRAERRGFISGAELDDWLAAEAEVDVQLRQ
jgi:hypothetical protein